MEKKVMHICFTSDNGYVPHLSTAIFSLLKNKSSHNTIYLYILDGGISPENKDRLRKIIQDFSLSYIKFLKVNTDTFATYSSTINVATYYRLAIDSYEEFSSLDKLLYLDSDIVVHGDISSLFGMDLGENYFGAVSEITLRHYYIDKLGLSERKTFFNAGVLLLNLPKIREDNFLEKVRSYVINEKEIFDNDQQALNVLSVDHWLTLPPKFNALPFVFFSGNYSILGYSMDDYLEARNHPGVIHYAGEKPWKYFCDHPLKYIYWDYRNETLFRDINRSSTDGFSIGGFIQFMVRKIFTLLMTQLSEKQYHMFVYKPKQKLRDLFHLFG